MTRQEQSAGATGSPTGPVRRRHRYYLWVLLALLLVVAGSVAAAPALISTPWGRNAVLGWINGTIPGSIAVKDLSLSWLGGQAVHSLTINDSHGQPVLKIEEFTTDLSLLGALRSRLSLGRTLVRGLDADLSFAADGTSNLARSLGGRGAGEGSGGGGAVFPVTGNMALVDSRMSISAPGMQPVVLDKLAGKVEMPGPRAPIKLTFGGESRQGDLRGNITLDGQIAGLFTDGRLSADKAQVNLNAGIDDLPVDALDQLLQLRGTLSAALGKRMSLHVRATGGTARQDLSVDASAPNADLRLKGSATQGRFELSEPATARLRLTPALVDAVVGAAAAGSGLQLTAPADLELTLKRLDVPLQQFSPSDIAVQTELDAGSPIRFTRVAGLGAVSLSGLHASVDSPRLGDEIRVRLNGKPTTGEGSGNLTVDAQVQHLLDDAGNLQTNKLAVRAQSSLTGVPTGLVDSLLHQGGMLTAAVGTTFDVSLNANTGEKGTIGVSVSMDSKRVKTGQLSFAVNDQLTLSRPAEVHFVLAPDLWKTAIGDGSGYALAQPSQWVLALKALRLPLPTARGPALQPDKTRLEATLTSPAMALEDAATHQATRLEDISLSLTGDSLDSVDLQGTARVVQKDGNLATMDASPLQVKLAARTGLAPDGTVKPVNTDVSLDAAGLKAALSATVDQDLGRLTLTKPATVETTLTPAMLAAWQQGAGPAAKLKEKAAVSATVNHLVVPLAPFDYTGLTADGSARVDAIDIESSDGVLTSIDGAQADFSFEGDKRGHAKVDLSGKVRSSDKRSGNLSLSVDASNLLDAKGGVSGDELSLRLDGKLQQLPVALVDRLMSMDGLMTAALGSTADMQASARLDRMHGPVSLTLNAPNTQAELKGEVSDKGLTLTEPLEAKFEPTPEFGQKVLSKIHPIFETTQRSEQPIRFEVPPEGVLIPIRNYDFAGITIPKMTLDFGKVVLKNGWMLRGITKLAQQFGKLGDVEREEWVAWFTPGVMQLENGRLLYSRRLDLLLADKLHLATWGTADIAADKSDLTLAFMPDTMKRVFRITVADNDALRVPIRGTLSSPSVDFKGAAADLARLRAQEAASSKNALAGALLGAVGGKVTGSGGPVPQASVEPLPWARQLKEQDAAEAQQEQAGKQREQTQPGSSQSAPAKSQSNEEQVIKGLIDIFGKKKKQ